MSEPKISVLMSMRNNAAYVRAAVESVLEQSFSDFEFLIVDDGSTDESAEIVAELAAADSRITLFRQEQRGIPASVNFLLEQARAPLIARMDSDDICLPDRFAVQVEFLAGRSEVGAVGTQYTTIDEEGERGASSSYPTQARDVRTMLETTQPLCNPSVLLRTALMRQVGGYRSAFRYCEDYDFFLRLSQVTEIENLPSVHFLYRRSKRQMSTQNGHLQTGQAVAALFAYKEVLAGRPDPFVGMDHIPAVEDMDRVFGRDGVSEDMSAELAIRLLHSRPALAGADFRHFKRHAASGKPFAGGWRTVARLIQFGLPGRAVQLAFALVIGKLSGRRA